MNDEHRCNTGLMQSETLVESGMPETTSVLRSALCAGLLLGTAVQVRTSPAAAPSEAKPTATFAAVASRSGAAMNSDLRQGGGTDDTAALQAVLDQGANRPVHLYIDGAALVSGLNVYSNTVIDCSNGGGLYLKDGSRRAILRNAHRSRGAIRDTRITVRNCFLNGNRWHQLGGPVPELAGTAFADLPNNLEADGTPLSGLQFLGVNDLTFEGVTLWNVRAFGAMIGNASQIDIRNVTVDTGAELGDERNYFNTDGIHFYGPIRYVTIDGGKFRTADDALSFTANDSNTDDLTVHNDFGPYVGQGPITDVAVNNVLLMDAGWGIRFLSSNQRIDRVTVSNVTGTLRGAYAVNISHYQNAASIGNFGSISVSNVNVEYSTPDPWFAEIRRRMHQTLDPKTAATKAVKDWAKIWAEETNDGIFALLTVDSPIESLTLSNIMTKASEGRPVLRFGPDANLRVVVADVSVDDPEFKAVPVQLDRGSHINRLDLSLRWAGAKADQGKSPIVSAGGTIGQLNWVATPPLYVGAGLRTDNTLVVKFSQDVKATDFGAGVTIKVNGKPARVSSATRAGRADMVRYKLQDRVDPASTLTWAYDAAKGNIQNWSGGQLLSVAEKIVASRAVATTE
jgi:hypothetical protein